MKWGLKGGISIDTDSGPLWYVLWCCGSRIWEAFTFFQIGSGHTVVSTGADQWFVRGCVNCKMTGVNFISNLLNDNFSDPNLYQGIRFFKKPCL